MILMAGSNQNISLSCFIYFIPDQLIKVIEYEWY